MRGDVRRPRDDCCTRCNGERRLGDRDTFLAGLLVMPTTQRERNDLWTYDVGSVRQGNGYDGWRKSEEKHNGDGDQAFGSGHPA